VYYSTAGATHVLCVSGLHVGFILAGVLLAAGALGVSKRAYLFVAVPTLFFYALMTGMGPAVVISSL